MLEICIQTSYDQNVQLILKSYLPVVLGTTLNTINKTKSNLNPTVLCDNYLSFDLRLLIIPLVYSILSYIVYLL